MSLVANLEISRRRARTMYINTIMLYCQMKLERAQPGGRHTETRSPAIPSRSPRYLWDQIGSHHQRFARYQETVLRSPLSKFSRGFQRNSRRILAISIA